MESLKKTETIIETFRIIRNATNNDVKFPSLKTTASILRLIIVSSSQTLYGTMPTSKKLPNLSQFWSH